MTRQKNVLLLCADMASAVHFSCYGGPAGLTPAIDSLAANGIRFTNAYCACPPCIPARVSMLCGQYGHTHGKSAHLKMPLAPRPALLPGILAANGYRTGIVGKTHWWPPRFQPGVPGHVPDDRQPPVPRTGRAGRVPAFSPRRGAVQLRSGHLDRREGQDRGAEPSVRLHQGQLDRRYRVPSPGELRGERRAVLPVLLLRGTARRFEGRAEERTGGAAIASAGNPPAPDRRRLRRTQAGTSAARHTRAVEQTAPRKGAVPAKRMQRHRHGGPQHRQNSAHGERPRPGG